VREGYRVDNIAMALKRLQASTPASAYCGPDSNSIRLVVPEEPSSHALCWTEQ
jgi:hypothetical protein